MHTILQKRIEEAAEAIAPFNRMSQKRDYFVKGCEWMLKNQWISVEEALPEANKNTKLSNKCFIARKGKFGCPDWFGDGYYDKEMGWINHSKRISNITYWMPIPSLKGGKE